MRWKRTKEGFEMRSSNGAYCRMIRAACKVGTIWAYSAYSSLGVELSDWDWTLRHAKSRCERFMKTASDSPAPRA